MKDREIERQKDRETERRSTKLTGGKVEREGEPDQEMLSDKTAPHHPPHWHYL